MARNVTKSAAKLGLLAMGTHSTDASAGRLEVLVEPFRENEPGPHVVAVLDLLRAAGLDVDMGPFSTTVEGPLDLLLPLVSELLAAGFEAGASSIQTRLERL